MGKCVSKQPAHHQSVLTIASSSEQDLAAANAIWRQFAAAASGDEFIARNPAPGLQLSAGVESVAGHIGDVAAVAPGNLLAVAAAGSEHGQYAEIGADSEVPSLTCHDCYDDQQQQQQQQHVDNDDNNDHDDDADDGDMLTAAGIAPARQFVIAATAAAEASNCKKNNSHNNNNKNNNNKESNSKSNISITHDNINININHKSSNDEEQQRQEQQQRQTAQDLAHCLARLTHRAEGNCSPVKFEAAPKNVWQNEKQRESANNENKHGTLLAQPKEQEKEQEKEKKKESKYSESLQTRQVVLLANVATDSRQTHVCQPTQKVVDSLIPDRLPLPGGKGQSESKSHGSKGKHGASGGLAEIQTKGTAMSFGFRKKLNSTPKKFKKLLEGNANDTSKQQKKHDKCNNTRKTGTGTGTNMGAGTGNTEAGQRRAVIDKGNKDDNGNAADYLTDTIYFEKVGAAAVAVAANGRCQSSTAAERPGASNRFGYRIGGGDVAAIARPNSACLVTNALEHAENLHNNNNNGNNNNNNNNTNNCSVAGAAGGVATKPSGGVLVSNLKRRSKSAHAGRAATANESDGSHGDGDVATPKIAQPKTLTFNLQQNTTIEYQRRQFFSQPPQLSQPPPTSASTSSAALAASSAARGFVRGGSRQQQYEQTLHAGMQANVVVRPTPREPPASYSKFTLQTVSLPKPEFPVAISLNATTPTTPGGVQSPAPTVGGGARSKERQHPLTSIHTVPQGLRHLDQKSVKQMANNSTRRGFSGTREISADSGIASMDMALDSSGSSVSSGMARRTASPKRSRSRPRNLQMVMSGRHTFEVRDVDDPPSSESNSFVETLALPKLPTDNSRALPLYGLVRSNTVLSRESYEREHSAKQVQLTGKSKQANDNALLQRNASQESTEDEEKLCLDCSTSEKSAKQLGRQFKDINTCSSKTSSPGSSIISSWCNAGESLAAKDCSSMSITSSSDDSNKMLSAAAAAAQQEDDDEKPEDLSLCLNDEDLSLIHTDMPLSTISSMTEAPGQVGSSPKQTTTSTDEWDCNKLERPRSFNNALNESKFAEMALASSDFLLEDETSPTDSLVSSSESEEAAGKLRKHKMNEELQEKDIDEISPELEIGSPISPGSPTHASHSLSLSDCGNLIDDEIADQPALLFNNEGQEASDLSANASYKQEKTDTPTLMETLTGSLRSSKGPPLKTRTALQQAIELSLRTPASVRRAVMERAESLDTLSPCESICSEDLMMDFDVNSSLDSIDRSIMANKSRSGNDLHKIDEADLFVELERKGSGVMKELNSLLRVRKSRSTEKTSVISHLPARATRLLNRSRLQDAAGGGDSDNSSRSAHSGAATRRSTNASRASTVSTASSTGKQRQQATRHGSGNSSSSSRQHQHNWQQQQRSELHSSSDDLMLYDKSFRNAMIQDVLQFKKQLLRLRRILQEDDVEFKKTETLNPFEHDTAQLFAACGLDGKQLDDIDLASLTSSTTEDPLQELVDLRRQVVYLQGQVDDRDRTIRLQRDLIEKLEAEKLAVPGGKHEIAKECVNIATQTERTRPLAIGAEGLSRSKPEYTSYTTFFPVLCKESPKTTTATTSTTVIRQQQQYPPGDNCKALNQTRRHTIISTTLTNYHNQQLATPRRASIAWDAPAAAMPTQTQTQTQTQLQTPNQAQMPYKPVRITLIGDPESYNNIINNNNNNNNNNNTCALRKPHGSCNSLGSKSQTHFHHQLHCQPQRHAVANLNATGKLNQPTVTIV